MYNWHDLLNVERLKKKGNNLPVDDDISKDYFEIITSSSFRRLQDKTQVYSLSKNDFVRTRLTHSIEVSTIAGIIGKAVWKELPSKRNEFPNLEDGYDYNDSDKVEKILECAGLLHDIGNPPLGHGGEKAISEFFADYFENDPKGSTLNLTEQMKTDLISFEGNAQALRVINRIHHARGTYGMSLTLAVMSSIIKYPIPSDQTNINSKHYTKHGFFLSDIDTFQYIRTKTGFAEDDINRNPLVCILEAADDIAYRLADVEDAYKNGLISYIDIYDSFKDYRTPFDDKYDSPCKILLKRFIPDDAQLDEFINSRVSLSQFSDIDVILADHFEDERTESLQSLLSSLRINCINRVVSVFTENYIQLMNGEYDNELIADDQIINDIFNSIANLISTKVYPSRDNSIHNLMYKTAIKGYLAKLVPQAIDWDENDNSLPDIPSQYKSIYREEINSLNADSDTEEMRTYLRILMVTDYVSGMTDRYAFENNKLLYQPYK